MRNSVTYPNWMLSYVDDHQLYHQCRLMTLGSQVHLLISWHEYVQQCYEVYAYITYKGLQVG